MTTAAAHVSTCRFASALPLSRAAKPVRRSFSSRVRCAANQQTRRVSRRSLSSSLVFLHVLSLSKDAVGAGMLDKYVKKKKLDPLEAYIPAVILTELQIKELGNALSLIHPITDLSYAGCSFDGKNELGRSSPNVAIKVEGEYLEVDQPKFADCRNLLRSGPASSLRINIRAVAQYADDAGNGKVAFKEVDQCLRALEELDSLLLRASRNASKTSIEPMKLEVATALNALNSLLKTVPAEVLDKGKAMADAYMTPGPGEDTAPENLDPQLKQLESIL